MNTRIRLVIAAVLAACCGVGVLLAQTRVIPVQSGGTPIPLSTTTELTHAGAPTWTSVVGLASMGRARTSLPTAVTNDQAVSPLANTTGAQGFFPQAVAFGGDTACAVVSTASTNAFNCATAAANMYELSAVNTTGTLAYLRLYNTASSPTCSSATGFVQSIPVPASTTGAGVVKTYPVGRAFATGVSGCITGGGSSTDNTNAPAGVYA